MPIKASAKKYMRVTDRKTTQNKIVKGVMKSAIKKVKLAVSNQDMNEARELFKDAQQAIDKAAKANIIKKNNAARKKSRLNAFIKKAITKE